MADENAVTERDAAHVEQHGDGDVNIEQPAPSEPEPSEPEADPDGE